MWRIVWFFFCFLFIVSFSLFCCHICRWKLAQRSSATRAWEFLKSQAKKKRRCCRDIIISLNPFDLKARKMLNAHTHVDIHTYPYIQAYELIINRNEIKCAANNSNGIRAWAHFVYTPSPLSSPSHPFLLLHITPCASEDTRISAATTASMMIVCSGIVAGMQNYFIHCN